MGEPETRSSHNCGTWASGRLFSPASPLSHRPRQESLFPVGNSDPAEPGKRCDQHVARLLNSVHKAQEPSEAVTLGGRDSATSRALLLEQGCPPWPSTRHPLALLRPRNRYLQRTGFKVHEGTGLMKEKLWPRLLGGARGSCLPMGTGVLLTECPPSGPGPCLPTATGGH